MAILSRRPILSIGPILVIANFTFFWRRYGDADSVRTEEKGDGNSERETHVQKDRLSEMGRWM